MTISNEKFAERLGYLASRGLRERNQDRAIDDSYNEGFHAGALAAQQNDECPYDPDRRCCDFECNGC